MVFSSLFLCNVCNELCVHAKAGKNKNKIFVEKWIELNGNYSQDVLLSNHRRLHLNAYNSLFFTVWFATSFSSFTVSLAKKCGFNNRFFLEFSDIFFYKNGFIFIMIICNSNKWSKGIKSESHWNHRNFTLNNFFSLRFVFSWITNFHFPIFF